jgi:hypothetical protein
MGNENGDKLNLHLEGGRVARPIAVAGDVEGLEGEVDIMTAMLEQMLKAGANAAPLVAQYNDKEAIITPAEVKKPE